VYIKFKHLAPVAAAAADDDDDDSECRQRSLVASLAVVSSTFHSPTALSTGRHIDNSTLTTVYDS